MFDCIYYIYICADVGDTKYFSPVPVMLYHISNASILFEYHGENNAPMYQYYKIK